MPAALVLSLAIDGRAQSIWSTTESGSWGNAANWLGSVPTIDVAAAITNSGNKVVSVDASAPLANRAARRLDLLAPAGSTNLLRLDNLGANPFQLANTLTLDSGGRLEVLNSFLQLDGSQGGNLNQFAGEILLSGGGITVTNTDPLGLNGQPGLRIGRSGIGKTTIMGGTMIAHDELIVGDLAGSDGTLILSDGVVRVGGPLTIANNFGSTGRVEIGGGEFVATNVTARIGDDGDGTLIQSGGTITMDGVSVGRGANSAGLLNLRGGTMRSGTLSVGRFPTAQGRLEISGGTLDLSTNSLYVGREGSGVVVLADGLVSVGAVIVAATNTASGTLEMRGGSLTTRVLTADHPAARIQFDAGKLMVTQSSSVANDAAFVVGNGVQPALLQLDGGAHIFTHGLVISSNATLTGSATVSGTITVLPGGSNLLGVTPPITLATGSFDGRFGFEFSSTVGMQYDVLAATRLDIPDWELQATLAGTGLRLIYTNLSSAEVRFFRVKIH